MLVAGLCVVVVVAGLCGWVCWWLRGGVMGVSMVAEGGVSF